MSQKIAIIGGGACGMAAAVTAAGQGACVTIYEGNDRLGKKLLATGNGKCNLGNRELSVKAYHSSDPALVKRSLEQFGTDQTIRFFEGLGLMIKEKNGGLYPVSEQASSVLDVLRMAVERLGVSVVYEAKVTRLKQLKNGQWELGWKDRKAVYDRVILACGSKAAPRSGSDGSGYLLARALGLKMIPVVPALVQLRCAEDFCKAIAGVRAEACIHINDGKEIIASERGELQLTEYGISGIPVFQLSRQVSVLLQEKGRQSERSLGKDRSLSAQIDFFPDIPKEEWQQLIRNRLKLFCDTQITLDEFFTGMLHKKLMTLFLKLAGLKTNTLLSRAQPEKIQEVFRLCRQFTLHITGSNSFENAQVCAGGVSLLEITDQFETKKYRGLYLAGELLDADGRCGGYNLQWAWTSGCLAGKAAAGEERNVGRKQ